MFDETRRRDEVAREDLIQFLNACQACTGQREFYDEGADEYAPRLSAAFLHEYVRGNYRRLYARCLAAGVNDFNRAQILLGLLATGRETPAEFRAEENALVRAAVRSLPPQRAYKLFRDLRERGVNNRRTRAVVRDFLAARPDAAFDAVKYRAKVRAAAAHAHLKLSGEMGPFLFGDWKGRKYETPLFETFRQAQFAQEALYRLPFTVAEGLTAKHNIPRDRFLARYAAEGRLTEAEKLRLQRSAEKGRRKAEIDFDLGRAPLTRLVLLLLALPREEREARRAELTDALRRSARRALRRAPLPLSGKRVAAVLDNSYSASGSEEKRRRPLAVALAAHFLLGEAGADEYRAFWTDCRAAGDPLMLSARGATDLATPLLDALEMRPDLIIVVSDGAENDPPEGAREVLRVYRERLERPGERRVEVVHLNPVFAAGGYEVRALFAPGDAPTVGLRDGEDLPTALGFARFAAGASSLADLERYLEERARRLIAPAADEEEEKEST